MRVVEALGRYLIVRFVCVGGCVNNDVFVPHFVNLLEHFFGLVCFHIAGAFVSVVTDWERVFGERDICAGSVF